MNLILQLAYDGTLLHGFQHQEGFETVEGILFVAMAACGLSICSSSWTKSSRTDRGVSSLDTVVSLTTQGQPPTFPCPLIEALNNRLPLSIRVLRVKELAANATFHARRQCISRRYLFLVPSSALPSDWMLIQNRILPHFLGSHSWHCFTSDIVEPGSKDAVRVIESFVIQDSDDGFCGFVIQGTGFKRKMIRKIVGLAIAVIRGIAPLGCISIALSTKADNVIVPVCPALGLILFQSSYGDALWSDDEVDASCRVAEIRSGITTLVLKAMKSEGIDQWNDFVKGLNDKNYHFTLWTESEHGTDKTPKASRGRDLGRDQSYMIISSLECYGST